MPTFAELINANPQQVQDLLDMAKASEAAKAASSLQEEAQAGQEMLAKLKETSEAPAEYASKKAKALAKSAKAAMGQVGEGVISDLPQMSGRMAAASEKAARAAAGTVGEGVIPMSGQTPSFLQRIASLAEKGGSSVLEKLGVSGEALSALASKSAPALKTGAKIGAKAALPLAIASEITSTPSAGANSDVTPNRQMSPQEMDYLASEGTPVNYQPPGESSKMNPVMASSMYDSPEKIVADLARAKEDPTRRLAAPESASGALKPAPRTVSAGEPSAAQVEKQEQDVALSNLLKSQGDEQSRYAELLNRFKDAQERQRMAQLGVGLTQAAERIGSSIAMVKPGDQTPYEQAMKLAGGITDEFKEEAAVAREAEKNDPNSAESRSMRALLKEQGIAVPDNISAAFIEKQYPQFANILSRREAAKERAELRRERAEERAERKFDRLDQEKRSIALRIAPKIQNKQYETLAELQSQKALIDEAVNNPNPQRDTTMFYAFVKALDPNSVVREGEIKFSQAARSIPASVRGLFNKGFKGQMLLPEERKNIQDFMNQRLSLAKGAWEASAAPYLKQAEESKIDRELIAPGISALESAPAKSEKKTIKLAQKLSGKAGKTFTDNKTGKKYVVNPDETSATEL
jgi:hypothetical protein